jgi:methylenetetrahydrofolate dehydrogenase (NADP+) / methenyltetrahydrofolate cyclohydrolase
MTERLEGRPVVEALDAETRAAIAKAGPQAAPPSLVSVHRDTDSPFRFYLRRQGKGAAAVGVRFREEPMAPNDGRRELRARLTALDGDPGVHAILLEHPLPPPFDFYEAISAIRPEKDVDGVGPANLGRLVAQRPVHVPAVALAAVAVARHYRAPIEGEAVAVVGRSETVGLPLALLLSSRAPGMNASVTVAHSRVHDLAKVLRNARTIFSCVGRPDLLNRSNVPEGAYVIDVGTSSVPDPSKPSGSRSVGDADADALDGWAAGLSPVPGGVGPVTVSELMASTVKAWRLESQGGVA